MSNVSELPRRDLIAEMTGPQQTGRAVVIDGRLVPNLVMYDRENEIEFVLDGRLAFAFPRDIAWLAAAFAFSAMATSAGFACPGGMHHTQRPFAPEVCVLSDLPRP